MIFRPMTKSKRAIAVISFIAAAVIMILWAVKCYGVNAKAFRSEAKIYKSGEFVPLEGNFNISGAENTDGYSVRVDSARLTDYKKVMSEYGKDISDSEVFDAPKYCIMLDLTIKNEGNETGYIHCFGLNLYNGALMIPINFELWNLMDENIKGSTVIRLRPNSEASLTIPYTAQPLDETMNKNELNRRLEDETLLFCVSEFPTIKLIEVETKNGL